MIHGNFPFNFQKTIEAAGLFLALRGGCMHNVPLMKLLYIADRVCLGREARTITGDKAFAMRKGPVLSRIHNLIREKDFQAPLWQHAIKTNGHDVVVANEPGTDNLCRFEKAIIEQIHVETVGKYIVQITHTFPEWQKYQADLESPETKNSYPITLEDILRGLCKSELMPRVAERIAEAHAYKNMFGE